MLKVVVSALRVSLLTFVLCGLAYPLALTGIGQLLFPFQANGSLIVENGRIIGSTLIGQNFTGSQYFHGRPSATTEPDPKDPGRTIAAPYNAANSAGSNLGPTSRDLSQRLLADRRTLEAAEPELAGKKLAADMLTSSSSGLDPDISPANASLQVARVAGAYGVPAAQIDTLLERHLIRRSLGIFGEPRLNVLGLNLELRQMFASKVRTP